VKNRGKKLTMVTTVPETAVAFLLGHCRKFKSEGWEVELITGYLNDNRNQEILLNEFDSVVSIASMRRSPSIFEDLKTLVNLIVVFVRGKPDLLMYVTPKASFLSAIAARISAVENTVFFLVGLRSEGASIRHLRFAIWIDKLPCFLSSRVICNSQSLKDQVVFRKFTSRDKVFLLGSGSACGVDLSKFTVRDKSLSATSLSPKGNSPEEQFVVGFVGRLTHDKGIMDLVEAVERLRQRGVYILLMVIGDIDSASPLTEMEIQKLNQKWIQRFNFSYEVARYYKSMDLFCLPSYREGFGQVNLEAWACGVPVVTTTATGCRDSVPPYAKKYLVEPGDVDELSEIILNLLRNEKELELLSQLGRKWVETSFDERTVEKDFYELLTKGS
jgi:glycosyltransferase involved in cell wall biosynthesis